MSTTGEREDDFTVVRTEAAMFARLGLHELSVKRYTRALELKSNDKKVLVARSRCYLKAGDVFKALTDADMALSDNATFHKGILRKAEALYQKGDFEMALVFFHRGKRLRPDVQAFSLGVQKASDAIENAVGTPDHVRLNNTGDLSFFDDEISAKKKKLALIKALTSTTVKAAPKALPRRDASSSNIQRRTVRQLLGDIYKDKVFLEKIIYAVDQSTESGKNISSVAEDCLRYLDKRSDFWQQQKPIYSRHRDQRVFRQRFGRKQVPTDYTMLSDLRKIDEAQSSTKYKSALQRASKCLNALGTYPDCQVTNKPALRGQLHSCMGNAHLELKQYDMALKHHQHDLSIGQKYGIVEGVSRSLDNIGRVHARHGDHEKAISVWDTKLGQATGGVETIWLCHKIGQSYLELGNNEEAYKYATAALDEAEADRHHVWTLHCAVLAAQCAMKMNDMALALTHFAKAQRTAAELKDTESDSIIKKAAEDIRYKMDREAQLKAKSEQLPANIKERTVSAVHRQSEVQEALALMQHTFAPQEVGDHRASGHE